MSNVKGIEALRAHLDRLPITHFGLSLSRLCYAAAIFGDMVQVFGERRLVDGE